MELRKNILVLIRRGWVIFITTFFAVIITAFGAADMPVTYTATSTVRVLTTRVGGADYSYFDVDYSNRLVRTYAKIAISEPMTEELLKSINRKPKKITVNVVSETELIQISVEDTDPGLAEFAANKLAQILIIKSQEQYANESSPISIYLVDPAIYPIKPSSLNPWVLVLLGLLIGIVGGAGLAFVFENIDSRIYYIEDMEKVTGLPVIGNIPKIDLQSMEAGLFANRLHVEAFRRLRTNIITPTRQEIIKTILITSSVREDGKSTVSSNLALSIAQTDHEVIIIDANLRTPTIHKLFNLNNEKGLKQFLNGEISIADAIQKTYYPGVNVITSGGTPLDPIELLSSERMNVLLRELRDKYDYTIVDTPSLLTVSDPIVIAPLMDSVLIVVRIGWVRREALLSTQTQLNNVKAKITGIIANRTELGRKSRFSKTQIKSIHEQNNIDTNKMSIR